MFKDSVFDRYRDDATFRMVVDSLEAVIQTAQLTPLEVRQAAMCAAIRFEQRQLPKPIYIPREDFDKWFQPDIEANPPLGRSSDALLTFSEADNLPSWERRRRG